MQKFADSFHEPWTASARSRGEPVSGVKIGLVGPGAHGRQYVRRARHACAGTVTRSRSRAHRPGANGYLARGARLQARGAARRLADGACGERPRAPTRRCSGCLSRKTCSSTAATWNFRDSQRRGKERSRRASASSTPGVSGGVWGLEGGYCVMVGGDAEAFALIEPPPRPDRSRRLRQTSGAAGAGPLHEDSPQRDRVRMMQSFAEGFEIMNASDFDLDLRQPRGALAARLGRPGSRCSSCSSARSTRIRARASGLRRGLADDAGDGVADQERAGERADFRTDAFASRQDESFAAKVNAALRNQFGGHAVKRTGDES